MSYLEDQKEWLKKHPDIKIGSNIFILYDDFLKEKSNWGCNWAYTMNKTVGKKGIISDINFRGIKIKTDLGFFWYPFYVLGSDKQISIFITFPNGEKRELDSLDSGHKLVSNLVLDLKKKDIVLFEINGFSMDALCLYNPYLNSTAKNFMDKIYLF